MQPRVEDSLRKDQCDCGHLDLPPIFIGEGVRKEPALECWRCHQLFDRREGYVYRGDFYCEECIWLLADNGEFYC